MNEDRYTNGTCPMTCPNFKRKSESIAEYQRIEKTLRATIDELKAEKNLDKENRRMVKIVVEGFTNKDKDKIRAALKDNPE